MYGAAILDCELRVTENSPKFRPVDFSPNTVNKFMHQSLVWPCPSHLKLNPSFPLQVYLLIQWICVGALKATTMQVAYTQKFSLCGRPSFHQNTTELLCCGSFEWNSLLWPKCSNNKAHFQVRRVKIIFKSVATLKSCQRLWQFTKCHKLFQHEFIFCPT